MKKNGDANNNPVLIIIIATIFTLGGALALILLKNGFDAVLLGVGLALVVVGILLLVFGILRAKAIKAYRELLNNPNAHITQATFVKAKLSSYSSKSVGVGGLSVPTSVNVYKKIIYTYNDENGTSHTAKSTISYTSNQVDFLKNKQTFKIKCKGNISAIIEEIPAQNKNFNF